MPNVKSLRLVPPSHEHVKSFLSKCALLKVDLLQDHQIYCLQACMCALYSPEIFTGFGSEGVKQSLVRAGDVIRLECMCFPRLVRSLFFSRLSRSARAGDVISHVACWFVQPCD